MSEFVAVAAQEVNAGQNILFTDSPVKGTKCIYHREGSGLVTLRGITDQCFATFKVQYSGNIGLPTGGTIGEIQVAIAINGEPVQSSVMMAYPAAVSEYWNVSAPIYIKVPKGCCTTIAVENTSANTISVMNSNLVVERVA